MISIRKMRHLDLDDVKSKKHWRGDSHPSSPSALQSTAVHSLRLLLEQ